MYKHPALKGLMLAATVLAASASASAQTVKLGVVATLTGSNSLLGEHMDKAIKLYMDMHKTDLPPGVNVQVVIRDDGGPNPDKSKQLAQELIVREKVDILTGIVWSPNGAAIAPLATEAKIPTVLMQAGASANITMSPYFIRFSFGTWAAPYYMGAYAAKHYKRVYIAVSDYAPGVDSETAFEKAYKEGNSDGTIIGRVRMPLSTADFVPFLQRAKDASPDALFVFVPAGKLGASIMKTFGDLGLDKAGIKLIGTGDITADEELPTMGNTPLGVITVSHYSGGGDRPANRSFIAAWKKAYGESSIPSFTAVHAWDAMGGIYHAIREQKGKLNPERTIELLRNYKTNDSPRGPIAIDPRTRDIRQNEYIREVRSVDGKLVNVELEVVGNMVVDPWVETNTK